MFFSIEELVRQAENYPSVAELMIAVEMDMSGRPREQIIAIMEKTSVSWNNPSLKETKV